MPVCDVYDAKEYHILVDYDGKEDLIEFLGKEVNKKTCNACIRGQYELENTKYGKPVKVSVVCPTCNTKDKMSIYIKFV